MAYEITTSILGLILPDGNCPDNQSGGPINLITAAVKVLEQAIGNEQVITTAGAITITQGTVILHTGTAGAITLALPAAGLPATGGNDTQELTIMAYDAEAYTVTTPSNGYNNAHHIATFGGAAGDTLTVRGYNGFWFVKSLNGVVIS